MNGIYRLLLLNSRNHHLVMENRGNLLKCEMSAPQKEVYMVEQTRIYLVFEQMKDGNKTDN